MQVGTYMAIGKKDDAFLNINVKFDLKCFLVWFFKSVIVLLWIVSV